MSVKLGTGLVIFTVYAINFSNELAYPLESYGPANVETVELVVAPPSKASEHPSASLSKSNWLGIPSPSVSSTDEHSVKILI